MKRLLTALLLIQVLTLHAQMTDRPSPSFELSGGIQLYRLQGYYTEPNSNIRLNINSYDPIFNLMGSGNIPFKQMNEETWFGFSPGLALGFYYTTFTADLPLLATIKYGAGSSQNSEKNIGFGIGGGALLSAFTTALLPEYFGSSLRYSAFYVAPTVMGEVTLDISQSVYQIRVDFTPVSIHKTDTKFIGDISQYNLRITRLF